ncbi:MAG: ABC transporter ATP-binding protein [Firmicutes bacterium]|nr:ABC transporter ATP-binding protein [Bacillota bacterium]
MIRTEGLTKRFDDLVAVDNLDLHVEKGEIYGFLGPNGAGKTTTIMMLLGLIKPTAGRIWLFGKDLSEDYFNIKRRIGVLSEFHYLYEDMTAEEYLRFFGELYGVEDIDNRIKEVLGLVNLYHRRKELLGGYSKGMKQKFSLARTLLHKPEILILDEPVSSLDPHGIKEVRDILLEENRKGTTMLISSHILSEIERTCHRVAIIHKGKLVAQDTMDGLRRKLTEETEMYVTVEGLTDAIVDALRELPFIRSLSVDGQTVTLRMDADKDYRGDLSRKIVDLGGVVLDMRRHEMSLEEAFVTITEKNINLLAKEGSAA